MRRTVWEECKNNGSSFGRDVISLCRQGRFKEALRILENVVHDGFQVHSLVCVCLLQACLSLKHISEGRQIHAHIIKTTFKTNVLLETMLVDTYAKHGSLEDACRVFDKMPERNEFVTITAYGWHWHYEDALKLSLQMQSKIVKTSEGELMSILNSSANLLALDVGRHVHAFINRSTYKSISLESTLVNMYAKSGCIEDARNVFDKMPKHDLVSWTTMISGYARLGLSMEVLRLFLQMEHEKVNPNEVTFVSILKACASLGALEQGKQTHVHIMTSELQLDVFLESALVDMYAKCGNIEDARKVFDRMPAQDVVTWTAMIAGYGQHGQGEEALRLYHEMQSEGVKPNEITLSTILNACAGLGNLNLGRQIHSHMINYGIDTSMFVGNTMVDMYAKCGNIEDAWQMFNKISNRNVVSWTSMITGYTRNGHAEKAIELFHKMEKEDVKPNMVTCLSVISACAHLGNLELGEQVHARLYASGLKPDIFVRNTLVDMYGKCGSIKNARKIFEEMPERNVVSWTAIIAACTRHELHEEAFNLFQEMHWKGVKPTEITFTSILNACATLGNVERGKLIHDLTIRMEVPLSVYLASSLVNMYAKSGSLEEAKQVFDKMSEQNLVSWNGVIAGYAQYGDAKEAFKLFRNMEQQCMEADEATLVSMLNAAANLTSLRNGAQLHVRIMESRFESDVYVTSALIDMYAKCGSIKDARQVFDKISFRNVVLWTAIVAGYAQHGYGKEALELVYQMQQEGIKLNSVTFIGVLSACSHAGLVDEGQYCFHSMIQDHDITPAVEHYACMVDLLGRCGQLQEADDVMNNMPFPPSSVVWLALLGACRIHADEGLAKLATDNIYRLEPLKVSGFVLLSNIYAAAGRWDIGTMPQEEKEAPAPPLGK